MSEIEKLRQENKKLKEENEKLINIIMNPDNNITINLDMNLANAILEHIQKDDILEGDEWKH